MTREETFGVWAPPMTAWSDWVKPVLFAHINPNRAVAAVVPTDPALMSWLPSPDGTCVLVIDLPAEAGLSAVAAAALRGYRPVPLYNALPVPAGRPKDSAVCDMTPHLDGITDLTGLLQTLTLPPDAPPAFLLDSLRSVATGRLDPGRFDNRSVSLPTDFPSANLLLSRGVKVAIVVQTQSTQPSVDLAHTLLRWQRAGIDIRVAAIAEAAQPRQITVARPSLFRVFFQRVLAAMGFRRSPLGGFGGVLPEPSSSSG